MCIHVMEGKEFGDFQEKFLTTDDVFRQVTEVMLLRYFEHFQFLDQAYFFK